MDYTTMSPKEVRALIAKGEITGPTAGMCAGYAQANLVILPKDLGLRCVKSRKSVTCMD